ncbi:MAG TPA: hypothetical protein VF017_13205 [Thermoanaerobaculia bacterium]|nr:hypothetical protein [Thermoanaerobaculia bacterium]
MSRWISRIALSFVLVASTLPAWAEGSNAEAELGWVGRLAAWVQAGWETILGASPAPRAEAPAQSAPEKAGWEWDPWGRTNSSVAGEAGWEWDPWG